MDRYEIRDLDDARALVTQGLCLQRALSPEPKTVRPALEWALELLAQGRPLPPVGFVADVGHVALGADWESSVGRPRQSPPGVPSYLLPTYEDHVLGKIYGDWSFTTAGE